MNRQHSSKKSSAFTIPLLTAAILATPMLSVSAIELRDNTSSSSNSTLAAEIGTQIAQRSYSCHQVIAERGLYVREKPTVDSEAVGIIAYGRNSAFVAFCLSPNISISASPIAPAKRRANGSWIRASGRSVSSARYIATKWAVSEIFLL